MRAASLFSGVGGLDLGLQRAGFDHVLFAEIDPWRRSVLEAHWPGRPVYPDVRRVATAVRADLLAGGFPCQDVSVAGRRAGLAGAQSGLFYEFARVAAAIRPRWILLENVPGLLSSNDGRDLGAVLGTLADLGYGWAYRILDARYFGVAQRRRRVFVVGCAGADAARALSAVCESCARDLDAGRCTWQTASGRAPAGAGSVGGVVTSLDRQRGGPDDNAAQGGHLVAVAEPLKGQRGKGGGGVGPEEPLVAMTLTKNHGTGQAPDERDYLPTSVGVRRLTPVECERLMAWPDGWTAPPGVRASDGRRFAACGDGVVANVAEWIGRRIIAADANAQ